MLSPVKLQIDHCPPSDPELDAEASAFIARVCSKPGGFGALSRTLLEAYTTSQGLGRRLEESRSLLESTTIDRLRHVHGKLSEVSLATEVAATDILDGLNRGLELIERALGDEGEQAGPHTEVLASLREELYGVMVHLQFQDITSQQLRSISSLLVETRDQVNEILDAVAPYAIVLDPAETPAEQAPDPNAGTYDPDATTLRATERQAAADELIAALSERGSGRPAA